MPNGTGVMRPDGCRLVFPLSLIIEAWGLPLVLLSPFRLNLPMPKATDIHTTGAALYFLPVETRMPLKFGPETTTSVTCARVRLTVTDSQGRTAEGWGET